MAQTLSIGTCTDLNLSPNGGSLLLYLERAGIEANRRILSPLRISLSAAIFPLPILLAKYGWCTLSGAEVEDILKL
jgi:hypothetical protein